MSMCICFDATGTDCYIYTYVKRPRRLIYSWLFYPWRRARYLVPIRLLPTISLCRVTSKKRECLVYDCRIRSKLSGSAALFDSYAEDVRLEFHSGTGCNCWDCAQSTEVPAGEFRDFGFRQNTKVYSQIQQSSLIRESCQSTSKFWSWCEVFECPPFHPR